VSVYEPPRWLRERACRTLGHQQPAALGLDACPIPFVDTVEALCDLVEEQRSTIARLTDEVLDRDGIEGR
jgi:hypothetical protein